MKAIFAILALLVATSYAAPAKILEIPTKGESPLKHDVLKGDAAVQVKGELWIPFWGFFSNMFTKKQIPVHNDEMKLAKAVNEPPKREAPKEADFDTSAELLEAQSVHFFGVSSEETELPKVDSDEVRLGNYRAPEHVRDALLYGKVMPKRADFSDYGDFLEETNKHLMMPVVHKVVEEPAKSSWSSWFSWW